MLARNEVVKELLVWDLFGAETSIELTSIMFPQL
jgi:hypothetical protein